jgi:SAM-dependent methyltransferase
LRTGDLVLGNGGEIYAASRAYEIAFSYRDIAAEVDAILAWSTGVLGAMPVSAVELASGPGDHALELARRGIQSTALDLSPSMCKRARERAAEQCLPLVVVTADMRDFSLATPVELAITMLDSTTHLLTAADMTSHLKAVWRNVALGGCYIVEMSHPSGIESDDATTQSEWEMRDGAERVRIRWGSPDDETDSATGLRLVRVVMEYSYGEQQSVIDEIVPSHAWSEHALDSAISSAGGWQVVARYGSFDGIELEAPTAWRMITVLRRDHEVPAT